MPFTDKQIRDYALQLESKGASSADIEQFVSSAKAEQGTSVNDAMPDYAGAYSGMGGGIMSPKMAGNVVKVAAPLAAAPFVGGMSIPAAAAVMGGAAVVGEVAGNKIAGQPNTLPRMAGAAILGGAPVARPVAAPFMSGQFLANLGRGGASVGGAALAASYAEQALEKGTFLPFDNYKEVFKETITPALVGAASLGLSGRLKSVAATQAQADAAKAAMAEIGVKNPQLGDLLPKYGPLQERVSAHYPEIAAKVAQSRAPITREFYSMIGDVPSNEVVAARMKPFMDSMDSAEAAYKSAMDKAAKAQAKAQAAQADMRLSVEQRSKLLQEATTEELQSISDEAVSKIRQQLVADSVGTQTGKAESLKGVVGRLFGARSKAADSMMQATGIDVKEPLFDTQTLMDAARKALGERADTVAGKAILGVIEKGKMAGANPKDALRTALLEKARSGQPMTAAEYRSFTQPAASADLLSLNELRQVRDKMSDAFAGKIDTNAMDSAEQLASQAYAAMGKASKGAIQARYGQESLRAYDQFLDFWRRTSQLRDSAFGRALLRGEVSDQAVSSMANKMAGGEVDEIKNFKRFVDVIRGQNKEVSDMAMATMGSAIRNSFLEQASSGGAVDYRKLYSLLNGAASKKDFPFPIEQMRFGTRETINGWNRAIQEFKPSQITPSQIQDVMESPQVQEMLAAGGKDIAPRLRTILASKAFNKRVLEAEALKANGLTAQSRRAYDEAARLATTAQLDADRAGKVVQDVANDPLLSIFKGRSGYKLTNEASKLRGPGTITDLVANMNRADGAAMMKALRKDVPDLADMVERRLLAGEFDKFMARETNIPGETYRLDMGKMRAYFNPPQHLRQDSDIAKLGDVIGREKVDRFRKFATAVASMDDRARTATLTAGSSHPVDEAVVLGRMAGTGSLARGYFAGKFMGAARGQLARKQFNLLSAMIVDDGFLNAMERAGGDVGEALASLPLQKAYLLMHDREFAQDLGKN